MTRTSDPDARRVQRTDRLPDLLRERILILDGAMGTMIQTHQLDEAAFRGERFRDHPSDLRGANDLLVLTRPDVIEGIHARLPGRRCRRHLHQHLQRQRRLHGATTAWSR